MKVAITGASGFLGWHLAVRIKALGDHEVVPITRASMTDPDRAVANFRSVDAVVHLAGVNRGDPEDVEYGNRWAAQSLIEVLDAAGSTPVVIYGNSIQAGSNTPYGRSKMAAASTLQAWSERSSSRFVDLHLPNLFGEGCRPNYNSFIATFCYRLAQGKSLRIDEDRKVPLLHAQDAAAVILDLIDHSGDRDVVELDGRSLLVSETATLIGDIARTYARGEFPDLSDPLTLQLFNTYRYYLHPRAFPRYLDPKSDDRGTFFEMVQARGGQGQTSSSITRRGVTRGNHYHLRKVERFVVLGGDAEIRIRPVARPDVAVFRVSGTTPAYVDMPTLHTHSITNVGDTDLLTLFWINELYDPEDPDTFAEPVLI